MKNKKLFVFSFLSLSTLVVASQVIAVSCTSVESNYVEKNKETNKLKEQNIINKLEQNSKLDKEEREDVSNKQKEYFSCLSLDIINQYLLDNVNISLKEYFINLNNQNKLTSSNLAYIDPDLGISLVNDVLEGKILIKDIQDTFDDFKQNNHQEYVDALAQMNLTEKRVEEITDIEDVVTTDKEEIDINNEFDQINKDEIENPEDSIEIDGLFKLNEKYNEGDIINIDFKRDGSFFEFVDSEKLENVYINDYDLYFDKPITVTIEMNDGTQINIQDFDISELEIYWYREGNLKWYGVTEVKYNDKQIFKYKEGGWKDGFRYISSIHYTFNKLVNKINDDNNKILNKIDSDTYILSYDKNTYDSISFLQEKIKSLQKYYKGSEILNIASWTLTGIAWAVAATWTVASILSFGATSSLAIAATIQATSLTLTSSITSVELRNTKQNLNKFIKLFNSNEYNFLKQLFDKYDFDIVHDINKKTIKISKDVVEILEENGIIREIKSVKILSFGDLFSSPLERTERYVKKLVKNFKNNSTKSTISLTTKLSKKIYSKMQKTFAKELAQKLTCLATSWANPISIVIDAFDIVLDIINLCNEMFYISN